MARIMLGCVAREVIDVACDPKYAPHVGLIASHAQVGPGDKQGYSGLSADRLCELVAESENFGVEIWRDHAGACNTVHEDARAGFDGYMPDTLYPNHLRDLAESMLHVEAGYGEHVSFDPDWRTHASHCLELGCTVTRVSTWLGTFMNTGQNSMDRTYAAGVLEDVCGWISNVEDQRDVNIRIRAHNCDWLDRDTLRFMRDHGVEDFNFAPELGRVICDGFFADPAVTREESAVIAGAVFTDARYLRWHPRDWRYGFHYVLEKYRRAPETRYVHVTNAVRAWLEERIEWLNS